MQRIVRQLLATVSELAPFWALRHVCDSQTRHETLPLVESMCVWLLSTTLQHDVEATLRPGGVKCSLYDRTSVALAAIVVVGDDVIDIAVLATFPKQVRSGYQHACRDDSSILIRYKYSDPILSKRASSYFSSGFNRRDMLTDRRVLKQCQQRIEIG